MQLFPQYPLNKISISLSLDLNKHVLNIHAPTKKYQTFFHNVQPNCLCPENCQNDSFVEKYFYTVKQLIQIHMYST